VKREFWFFEGRPGIFRFRYPEIGMTAVLGAFALYFSWLTGAPFSLPDLKATWFIGFHYSLPLVLAALWLVVALVGLRRRGGGAEDRQRLNRYAWQFLSYFFTFSAVMILHLNIKLWLPLITSVRLDRFYYCIDLQLQPLIDAMMTARDVIADLAPDHSTSWYLLGFVALFFVSFAYHAVVDKHRLRNVFLAVLFVEAIGPLTYLLAPALGPFLFDTGLNISSASNQGIMREVRLEILENPQWLAQWGPRYFISGLAAMPSLHAGASWVFVHYAFKFRTPMIPIYLVIYFWIIIEAVATKWHYLIDLPVGIVLAMLCIFAAERFCAADPEAQEAEREIARRRAG
jgi:hypothetical protein|tara:strand:+ start:438 stop:1469 length:1032 start_codon:yes stop_codon:yes gene_type:complete